MTIYDIVTSCGSISSDTLIIIAEYCGDVKWKNLFKNLPREYDNLRIKFFTIGFMIYKGNLKMYFKFYV